MSEFAAVILAAGKSTRMKSRLPKPLHNLCGKPITRHVIDACFAAGVSKAVVVVGFEAKRVKAGLGGDVSYVVQRDQLGTGHACAQAKRAVGGTARHVLVLPGDAPLIRPETLKKLCELHVSSDAAATLLTGVLPDAIHYGRVVRNPDGSVARVVEAKDASPKILAIREFNTAIYCFDTRLLFEKLKQLKPENEQSEYYLTDVIGLLTKEDRRVEALVAEDPAETLGINTRVELAEAGQILRRRTLNDLMLSGVTVVDPDSTWVDVTVTIGPDTIIQPFTIIEGNTSVGERCNIGPFAHVADSTIEDGVVAGFCRIVRRTVKADAVVGPFENVDGESLSRWFAGPQTRSKTDGKR